MKEEIFGPVLTIYLYDNDKWDETIKLVDTTSEYGLTGCIIASDDEIIKQTTKNSLTLQEIFISMINPQARLLDNNHLEEAEHLAQMIRQALN